jgi:hypothetical protein
LSEEVEKALVQYLDSKKENNNNNLQNTHAHGEQKQVQQSNNNTKYQRLIETIKRYANSQRQISAGLAKKAIQQTIGKDQRTIDKYLKRLQDDDILYGNSILGVYDVQSWVFDDENHDLVIKQQQQQQ